MAGDPVRALATAPAPASARSLSTARSVLRVLTLLGQRPEGVRADEVADALGKSVSTAYYLLSSLCVEGFAVHASHGVYRPARPTPVAAEPPGPPGEELTGAVETLFARTRRRSYLAVAHARRIEIVAYRGRQGVPRIPGLRTEIRHAAHALALGKVVLAQLRTAELQRFSAAGLTRFTARTITSPPELSAELARVRADGIAVDREEFEENFCCVAAPVHDGHGRFVAALGLSVTTPAFDGDRERLVAAVGEVARSVGAAPRARGDGAVLANAS